MPRPTGTAEKANIVQDLIATKKSKEPKYRKELVFDTDMKNKLEERAAQLGLTVSGYIKYLIAKDLKDD